MNITVQVDEVTLATLVREASEYGDGKTIGDEVALLVVQRLIAGRDGWESIAERVRNIRDEEVREAVRPLITEALTRPIRKHTLYGEAHGAETTLSAMIADEARAMLTKPAEQYTRDGKTIVGKIVAEEVQRAFKAEVADAVKQARAMVADEIGAQVADAVKQAMKR